MTFFKLFNKCGHKVEMLSWISNIWAYFGAYTAISNV